MIQNPYLMNQVYVDYYISKKKRISYLIALTRAECLTNNNKYVPVIKDIINVNYDFIIRHELINIWKRNL